MAALGEFFRTGRLGPVRLGQASEDVRRVLGDPEATSPGRTQPRLWKYGSLEVAFDTGELVFIGLYFRSSDPFPDSLHWTGYRPAQGTTMKGFVEYLQAEQLPFGEYEILTFDTQTCLEVGLGVHVLFDEGGRLDSIQYARGAPRSARKWTDR